MYVHVYNSLRYIYMSSICISCIMYISKDTEIHLISAYNNRWMFCVCALTHGLLHLQVVRLILTLGEADQIRSLAVDA